MSNGVTNVDKEVVPRTRDLWLGCLGWLVFSCVAVAVRGVRWDENYEFAQVILGQIPYPTGHPLFQYTHSFFSAQTYELAALMYFAPGPLFANAVRNVAFLAATVLPVFLLCTHLARRVSWGHAWVLLILIGIHLPFFSNYPAQVWPDIYSNGHVGLGYMLLVLWALLAGHHGVAGFLFGLAPAVHLGQLPPLLGLVVLYGAVAWRAGEGQRMKDFLLNAIPGFVFCVCFWFFIQWFAAAPPTAGPYFSAIAPETVWRGYMGASRIAPRLAIGDGPHCCGRVSATRFRGVRRTS